MQKTNVHFLGLVALALFCVAGPLQAEQTDYAQDVSISSDPSPRDLVTGSSVNQYGSGQTGSQIDNYAYQDEQINLNEDSGTVRVLRTNQKAGVNDFVTAMIPLFNVSPRELRGLARTICRKEGGDADVLWDKVSGVNYMVVVCPEFQLPHIARTLTALDQKWVSEVNDGSWIFYYKGRNRDVRNMMQILQLYRTPDGTWNFDDANNAVLFRDQPCIEKLFVWGTETVDIPPSQLMLEVAIYEVDTRNDLTLGVDWQALKNGPNRALFDFVSWDFGGDSELGLFPGSPDLIADHGRYRSYDVMMTTAYIDFLQSKGRARLLTQSVLSAKSGTVAELAAVDEVASFKVSSGSQGQDLVRPVPLQLDSVYHYYADQGRVIPLDALLAQPAASAINALDIFLRDVVGVAAASRAPVVKDLQERAADGNLSADDVAQTYVTSEVRLQVFHDRTLEYLKSGKVGVLMSIMPVVGLESAEVVLSLDVSDVNDFTPAGSPVIEHRYFSSVLQLTNGKPQVLSGIKRTTDVKTSSGIPWLRDLPWVGYAFGREVTMKRERELVVVMTPRFKLCPTDEPTPPAGLVEGINMVLGKEAIEVPKTVFGFDQWLIGDQHQAGVTP